MKRHLTITERGWPAHFICARYCLYRRNTLLSDGERHVVVSSVGNMISDERPGKVMLPEKIGADRYYETMVWRGFQDGLYIEADIGSQISTGESVPGGIYADDPKKLPKDVDLQADAVHEANVAWVRKNWKAIHGNPSPQAA